jgi:hypothetical protein
MDYDESDSRSLLERLRDESAEIIPGEGLFSPGFRAWHEAAPMLHGRPPPANREHRTSRVPECKKFLRSS